MELTTCLGFPGRIEIFTVLDFFVCAKTSQFLKTLGSKSIVKCGRYKSECKEYGTELHTFLRLFCSAKYVDNEI